MLAAQAKQLQFATWIDEHFPADPTKLGCLLRCPVSELTALISLSLQVVGHFHNSLLNFLSCFEFRKSFKWDSLG